MSKNPRLTCAFANAACFLTLLALPALGLAQDTPSFPGTSLPVPPEQPRPWSVPRSDLPPEAAAAITKLFDQGLADPRGCEYREISVVTGSVWGGASVMKTHGWIFSEKGQGNFAVSWSGLVYPLVSLGAPADLRADVLAFLKKDQVQIDAERAHFDQSEKQRAAAAARDGKPYVHTDWPCAGTPP